MTLKVQKAPVALVFALLLSLFQPLTARNSLAATLVNTDQRTHQLTVLGAGPGGVLNVAPGERLHKVCPEGCVLRLNGSSEHDYLIEGPELISIEDGTLYYEGEHPKTQNQEVGVETTGKNQRINP